MTAIAAITVSDGTSNHVFTPIQAAPPIYRNVADANVPDVGQEELQVSVIRAKGNGTHRVRVTTRSPILETTSGAAATGYIAAPAVAFTVMAVTDIFVPNRSSAAQRLITRNLHRNVLNDAQVIDAIEKLAQPY